MINRVNDNETIIVIAVIVIIIHIFIIITVFTIITILRNVVFAFLPPVESVESSGEAQVFQHFTSHHHHHHVVSTLPDHGVHDYHIGNDSNYDDDDNKIYGKNSQKTI